MERYNDKPISIIQRNGQDYFSFYPIVFYDGTEETEYVLGKSGETTIVERIHPSAADGLLEEEIDTLACVNHDPNQPLGMKSTGTLTLWRDAIGVGSDVAFNDEDQLHKETKARLGKVLRGSSFKASLNSDGEHWTTEGKKSVRNITRLFSLEDVSIVRKPAYKKTEKLLSRDSQYVSDALESYRRWQTQIRIERHK